MLTDIESLGNLLEVAEGKFYLELLFSFPLPYDVVCKYEAMRERIYKKVGLPHSTIKIWKLQNEANRKIKQKTAKNDETEKSIHEYLERLSSSHDITTKFSKLIEEIISNISKINNKLYEIVDNGLPKTFPFQVRSSEPEGVFYKDLVKFQEMEQTENRLFDFLFKKFHEKENEMLSVIQRIEDKFGFFKKSTQNLEAQIDSIAYKHEAEKKELESKIIELSERCASFSDQKEMFKVQSKNNEKSFQSLESQIDSIIMKHKAEKNEIEIKNQELSEKCAALGEQKELLKLQVKNHEKTIQNLENQLESVMYKQQNEKINEKTIQSLENQIESLIYKQQNEKINEKTIQKLENQLGKMKDELDLHRKINNELEEKLSSCKGKISDSDLQVNKLLEEIKSLRKINNELKEECINYQKICNEYRDELEKCRETMILKKNSPNDSLNNMHYHRLLENVKNLRIL